MQTYKDMDRLNTVIRRDVMSLLKRDVLKIIGEVSDKIDSVVENTESSGESKIIRLETGASIKVESDVPIDNVSEFVIGIDNAVKGTFRFGKWSDMKVD